jgi:hypothetical protein
VDLLSAEKNPPVRSGQETAYKTAKETGLQYRTLREFLKGDIVPNGRAIDALAEYFGLELKAKSKPKGRPSGPKPRK